LVWANRLAVRIAKAANVTRRDIPAFFRALAFEVDLPHGVVRSVIVFFLH